MTVPDRKTAIDSINGLFLAAWTAAPASQSADRIKWDNVGATSTPPAGAEAWARFVLRHGPSAQATLSGTQGNRRFRRTGVITIQIFQPSGRGLTGGQDLAKIIQDAYEGVTTPDGVIFRGVQINEVGEDGDFFQTNVVTTFEYDEIK